MTITLRKLALSAFLSVSALSAVTLTSCNKDEECAAGYEGSDCKTLVAQKFIGVWSASDKETVSGKALSSYVATITTSTDVTKVNIGDISDEYFENNVVGSVSGTKITITEQAPDSDGYTISGTGDLVSGKMVWNYTIKSPLNVALAYDGTWSK